MQLVRWRVRCPRPPLPPAPAALSHRAPPSHRPASDPPLPARPSNPAATAPQTPPSACPCGQRPRGRSHSPIPLGGALTRPSHYHLPRQARPSCCLRNTRRSFPPPAPLPRSSRAPARRARRKAKEGDCSRELSFAAAGRHWAGFQNASTPAEGAPGGGPKVVTAAGGADAAAGRPQVRICLHASSSRRTDLQRARGRSTQVAVAAGSEAGSGLGEMHGAAVQPHSWAHGGASGEATLNSK